MGAQTGTDSAAERRYRQIIDRLEAKEPALVRELTDIVGELLGEQEQITLMRHALQLRKMINGDFYQETDCEGPTLSDHEEIGIRNVVRADSNKTHRDLAGIRAEMKRWSA